MQIATVTYSVATYSGTVAVFNVDPDDEDAYIIARARKQVARGTSLPFGAESWQVTDRREQT